MQISTRLTSLNIKCRKHKYTVEQTTKINVANGTESTRRNIAEQSEAYFLVGKKIREFEGTARHAPSSSGGSGGPINIFFTEEKCKTPQGTELIPMSLCEARWISIFHSSNLPSRFSTKKFRLAAKNYASGQKSPSQPRTYKPTTPGTEHYPCPLPSRWPDNPRPYCTNCSQ